MLSIVAVVLLYLLLGGFNFTFAAAPEARNNEVVDGLNAGLTSNDSVGATASGANTTQIDVQTVTASVHDKDAVSTTGAIAGPLNFEVDPSTELTSNDCVDATASGIATIQMNQSVTAPAHDENAVSTESCSCMLPLQVP